MAGKIPEIAVLGAGVVELSHGTGQLGKLCIAEGVRIHKAVRPQNTDMTGLLLRQGEGLIAPQRQEILPGVDSGSILPGLPQSILLQDGRIVRQGIKIQLPRRSNPGIDRPGGIVFSGIAAVAVELPQIPMLSQTVPLEQRRSGFLHLRSSRRWGPGHFFIEKETGIPLRVFPGLDAKAAGLRIPGQPENLIPHPGGQRKAALPAMKLPCPLLLCQRPVFPGSKGKPCGGAQGNPHGILRKGQLPKGIGRGHHCIALHLPGTGRKAGAPFRLEGSRSRAIGKHQHIPPVRQLLRGGDPAAEALPPGRKRQQQEQQLGHQHRNQRPPPVHGIIPPVPCLSKPKFSCRKNVHCGVCCQTGCYIAAAHRYTATVPPLPPPPKQGGSSVG